jgi:hypothetical protein
MKGMALLIVTLVLMIGLPNAARATPQYEAAYFDNQTVTINAIEVHQNANTLTHATADFYLVVYPRDRTLWPSEPQCAPCDHDGQGIDFIDFHDHVLDSIPADPGHGEYSPLWHVFAIIPLPNKEAEYAARLPVKTEAAVDALVDSGLALEVDLNFYFVCSVVNEQAERQMINAANR